MKLLKLTTKKSEKAKDARDEARRLAGVFKEGAFAERYAERAAAANEAYLASVEGFAEAVEAALHDVNGRAKSFALTSYENLLGIVRYAEAKLAERGLTRNSMVGTVVEYTPAGPSAKRYKYAAKATMVTLKRVADGWRLVDAKETTVYPTQNERLRLSVTEAARDVMLRHTFDGIAVQSEVDA